MGREGSRPAGVDGGRCEELGRSGELFERLLEVMARLRAGCPWDRAQTIRTIKDYFLEEAHEAYEAAERRDWKALAEELGDVLFEVAFLQRLACEETGLRMDEVLQGIIQKLVRRHPHVFSGLEVRDEEEVARNWRAIKERERGGKGRATDGVPRSLPPLLQAVRLLERRGDGEEPGVTIRRLGARLAELESLLDRGRLGPADRLIGAMLLDLVRLGRHLGVAAHDALVETLDRELR